MDRRSIVTSPTKSVGVPSLLLSLQGNKLPSSFCVHRSGRGFVKVLLSLAVSATIAVTGPQILAAQPAPPAAASASLRILGVEPTVFHVHKDGRLQQVAEVAIENTGEPATVELVCWLGNTSWTTPRQSVPQGESRLMIEIPRVDEPTPLQIALRVRGAVVDRQRLLWQPSRLWEVCLVPISHHDLGYTSTIEEVLEQYDHFYDAVLHFCDETADFPDEAKFRYTIEGSWSLEHYLRSRPAEVVQKMGQYLREGRIEVQALPGNLITNLLGHEEQIRAVYPSFRMKRRFDAEIRTASTTDIPGLSWGLPTVLGGSGVRYFFAGLATYFEWGRSDIPTFWNEAAILRRGRPDAFWWEGPDGSRILVYYQGGYGCWSPGSYEEAVDYLRIVLRELEKQGSPFSVIRFGGYGCYDNTPPSLSPSLVVREWNNRWAYPRLYVATSSMFFDKLHPQCEAQADIRTFRGDIPETDYVVGATSTARETTLNRLTHTQLPAAERWAALAHLLGGTHYPAEAIAAAYNDMILYDEHTWGMAHPIGRRQDWSWADKARYAYRAAGLTSTLLAESLGQLAGAVARPEPGLYVVVFNPLGFPRTDVVRVPNLGAPGQGFHPEMPPQVVDVTTGEILPAQIVEITSPQAPVPDAPHRYGRGQFEPAEKFDLLFLAKEVPPLGWKTYRVMAQPAGDAERKPPLAEGGPPVLENRFFRIVLDPATGAVRSLFDKQLNRELIDPDAPFGLNQLVVKQIQTGSFATQQSAQITPGVAGPVCRSLQVSAQALGCPQVRQEITIYHELKRIDLATRILRDSMPMLELYFAFPLNVTPPQFAFEGSNSLIVPFRDQLPGTNTNYYAMQHWAAVSDGTMTAAVSPLEAHLVEFGGIWPCYVSQAHHGVTAPDFGRPFVRPEEITRGHIYFFVHASNFRTNFPVIQQAELLYRFTIGSFAGGWEGGEAALLGWSVAYPLTGVAIEGPSDGPLPPEFSLLRVEPEHLAILAFKKAEDGDGFILRLGELLGRPAQAKVHLTHLPASAVWMCNLVEEKESQLELQGQVLSLTVRPCQRITLRIVARVTTR